ncbi:flagellar basal body P-ring formation chaperone FlgA [Desulfohalovibrio reitneri]|uniref:flagellar basal body P-ring formation chaperone FlgA n=1 Tax=Desulfohalovibrio reitneri TaxID=1307759 RepID=UPI0005575B22|nr:flagellar basal body P-ring formation chaperone FlgA [Desulfohalovibrio reitneri]
MKRFPASLFLLPLALALAVAAWGGMASAATSGREWAVVTMRAACVQDGVVELGEIAAPFGPIPDKTWERLADTRVAKAPEQGRKVVINPDQLRWLMRRALGDEASVVSVKGGLTLQRGGYVVREEELRDVVVDFLTKRLSGMEGEIELRNLRLPDAVFLPGDFSELKVQEPDELEPGRVNLRIKALTADGRELRSIVAGAFVDRWIDVPVAGQPLNSGDVLTMDMVGHDRKNAAYFNGEPASMEGLPLRVTRSIGRGMVIYEDDLEGVPLIARGEKVRLEYRGENVTLRTRAEAETEGTFGDMIMVRNLQSGRKVRAQVWDDGTVVVK